MKAATQIAYFAPVPTLSLAPAWRFKAARRSAAAIKTAAAAQSYSRRSLLAAGELEDRVTGTLEIVSHFVLVSGLLGALGCCLWQFVQF